MAETFELEVVTPDRLLVREQVTETEIPLENGYIGVLPGHAPLLGEMGTGDLEYVAEGRRVRVLATSAEKADEIDVARAEESRKRALDRLSHPLADLDTARALSALH